MHAKPIRVCNRLVSTVAFDWCTGLIAVLYIYSLEFVRKVSACMTHSRSVDSEALTKWAFYSENRGAQPGRETVRMMALWLGASSVGHNPAAALRRGIPRDETVSARRFSMWVGHLPANGQVTIAP